jgi:hypothetical protein
MPEWVRNLLGPVLLLGWVAIGHGEDIQLWAHPINYWFEQRLPISLGSPIAYQAFQELGTNALPFLIGVLEHKPSLEAELADQTRKNYGPSFLTLEATPSFRPAPRLWTLREAPRK